MLTGVLAKKVIKKQPIKHVGGSNETLGICMYIPKVPRSMKIQSRSNQAARQHGWLITGNVGPEFFSP